MILEAFPLLEQVYSLKEEYLFFNCTCTYEEAVPRLPVISKKFRDSGIPQMDEFTKLLFHWQEEILNSFKRPYGDRKISNAFTENINGRIRTYLAVSNGLTNFQRFGKRVIYALSSDVYYALTSTLDSEKKDKQKRGTL